MTPHDHGILLLGLAVLNAEIAVSAITVERLPFKSMCFAVSTVCWIGLAVLKFWGLT